MTVHLDDILDREQLERLIADGYIHRKAHPSGDLVIHNYSHAAQYDRVWNNETRKCRGLITSPEGLVLYRPFEKFFDVRDPLTGTLPSASFDVFDKADGSLGILYEHDGLPAIATRGSFGGDQAPWATEFYRKHYGDYRPPAGVTLLFEIIVPWNRIVIDYGTREDLVLLAAIDTDTGADVALPSDWPGTIVDRYTGYDDVDDVVAALGDDWDNREGFVLRFDPATPGTPSTRTKVKFDEYVRLHRIMTGVSTVTLWEYLSQGLPLDDVIDRVPDEVYDWVDETVTKLRDDFDAIVKVAKDDLSRMPSSAQTRKDKAAYIKTCRYPGIMFALLDGHSVDKGVWKMLRPAHETPFRDSTPAA